MFSALEIANYLIYLMGNSYDDLSNMKLNKMLYYAQGHYLKKTGQPLFSEPIEAWQHGPIISDVYHAFKEYGDAPIKKYNVDKIKDIPEEISDLLIGITRTYGRFTAVALRNMTHVPKSPWSFVYRADEAHTIIPNSLIKEYFESSVPEIQPIELKLSEEDFVGYSDDEGILVLPKEWDDETI